MGDGFLMREGYTLVWVGWQFDVARRSLRIEAPARRTFRAGVTVTIDSERQAHGRDAERPAGVYAPVDPNEPTATLTVRDLFRETADAAAASRWRFGRTGRQRTPTPDAG